MIRRRGVGALAVVAVIGVVAAGVVLTRSGDDDGDARDDDRAATEVAPEPMRANPLVDEASRNPSVLRAPDGTYYAYVDGFDLEEPFRVMAYSSPDMTTWTAVGDVLDTPGAWADGSAGRRFTTPSVRHVPDAAPASRFVMYLTGPTAADGTTSCVGVATAAAPDGPFVGADDPLLCPPGGARSASAVPGSDQVVYRAAAGIEAITLTPDGTAVAADAAPVVLMPVEDGVLRRGVLERPAVARDADGRAYLFVRTGDEDDGVGWSPCRTSGPLVTTCAARTALGSWLAATSDVQAPGGVQVFGDGDGAQWIAYHAADAPDSEVVTMRIDRLCFAHGVPRTDGPTTGSVPTTRSPDCSTDVRGAPLVVDRVDDGETLDQPAEVTFREGGASIPLGGRLLWTYADTYIDPATRSDDGACVGTPASRSNTAGLGLPHPLAGRRGYAGGLAAETGCAGQLIPFTEGEETFTALRADLGRRVGLWESGGIPLDDGSALVFFMRGVQDRDLDGEGGPEFGCGFCREYHGMGVVRLAPGETVADRASTPVGCLQTCLFGPEDGDWFGRPFVADGFVYVYSDSPTPKEVRLGRAPLDDVLDRSAWTFRDADGRWSPDVADAAPIGGLIERPPLVSYNGHLDRFVSIASEGDSVTMRMAPEPWGPWGEPIAIHDLDATECEAIEAYGAIAAPALDDAGGRVVRFVYSRPGPSFGADPACPGQVRLVTVTLG